MADERNKGPQSFAEIMSWDTGPRHVVPCCDCGADVEISHGVWELARTVNGIITKSRKLNNCHATAKEQCSDECFREQTKRYIDPFSADRRCLGPPLGRSEIVRCGDCGIIFNEMHNRRANKFEFKPRAEKPKQQSLLDEIGDG